MELPPVGGRHNLAFQTDHSHGKGQPSGESDEASDCADTLPSETAVKREAGELPAAGPRSSDGTGSSGEAEERSGGTGETVVAMPVEAGGAVRRGMLDGRQQSSHETDVRTDEGVCETDEIEDAGERDDNTDVRDQRMDEADMALENQEKDTAVENQENDTALVIKEKDTGKENQENDTALVIKEKDTGKENQENDMALVIKEKDSEKLAADSRGGDSRLDDETEEDKKREKGDTKEDKREKGDTKEDNKRKDDTNEDKRAEDDTEEDNRARAIEAFRDKMFSILEDPEKKEGGKIFIRYQAATLILTFLVYVTYHMSRKPLSVVKNSLHRNCSTLHDAVHHPPNDTTWCDWKPFDSKDYDHLFGWLDVGFLGTYAACMFLSGYVAERMNLRYFLTIGMVASGTFTALFGVGYFLNIHNFYYYLGVQMLGGAFQSTGWPAVVATVGNWFGPGRRGAIMGLWNSHTSVGNILGALIPGVWADGEWGWSFIVPGIIIASLGFIVCGFLVPYPREAGLVINNSREGDPKTAYMNTNTDSDETPLLSRQGEENHAAVSLCRALRLPGVVEFSLCLFFAKLVSYTFLFWLPNYIGSTTDFSAQKSADLSTLFDVGGVVGGVIAGAVTDRNRSPGINCVVLLILGTPTLFIYQAYGSLSYANSIGLLLVCGALVNGPYALITTAVSADLGTQKALRGNKKALATVTSIIDGTGSIGAALGPLLTGRISPTGWQNVFYMLIFANICAALLLVRIVIKEARTLCGYAPAADDGEDIARLSREVYPDFAGNERSAYQQRVEEADYLSDMP